MLDTPASPVSGPASPDPALHAVDQRQGRGHGEDPAERLGLRQGVRVRRARSAALAPFVDFYNRERPHGGLNGARPIDRVRQWCRGAEQL